MLTFSHSKILDFFQSYYGLAKSKSIIRPVLMVPDKAKVQSALAPCLSLAALWQVCTPTIPTPLISLFYQSHKGVRGLRGPQASAVTDGMLSVSQVVAYMFMHRVSLQFLSLPLVPSPLDSGSTNPAPPICSHPSIVHDNEPKHKRARTSPINASLQVSLLSHRSPFLCWTSRKDHPQCLQRMLRPLPPTYKLQVLQDT